MSEDGLFFILDGHEVVPVASVEEWAEWFSANAPVVVRSDVLALPATDSVVTVATVFSGLRDDVSGDGPPLLFRTVARYRSDGDEASYSTWDEAVAGHEAMVARYQELIKRSIN
jgi:hypothetical protein